MMIHTVATFLGPLQTFQVESVELQPHLGGVDTMVKLVTSVNESLYGISVPGTFATFLLVLICSFLF